MSALTSDYQQAGFSGRLGFGEAPAVLVIDAVDAYVDASSPLHLPTAAGAVEAMRELVTTARAAGVPVAYTAVVFETANGQDAPLFFRKVPSLRVFEADSPLARFPETIAPAEGELVFKKKYASAFFGTTVATWLAANRIDTVLLCGFSTSGCVRASALDTLQHGFRPIVVRDAVADRDPAPHDANLFDLEAKYADVVSIDEATDFLRRNAANER